MSQVAVAGPAGLLTNSHALPSYNGTAILVQDDIVVGIKYSAFSLAVTRGPVTQFWPMTYKLLGGPSENIC